MNSPGLGGKHQDLRDLLDLPRSSLASHFRQKVDDLADVSRFPRLAAFAPWNLWPWVKSYLKYVFHRKHPFVTYPPQGERGCYEMSTANGSNDVRISIAGDWGTGTEEADRVAAHMHNSHPDYTIHLGDVYYVGDKEEIAENCLGKSTGDYKGVTWPKGEVGSFALNSNHEMYANGFGYFEALIPALGIPSSRDRAQLASFFCLQNDTWRILGLDTGYNSTGIPMIGLIPLLNRIPGIGPSCRLEEDLMEWLRTIVEPQRNPRATILLSHHQYFSAFEDHYPIPARQLAEIFAEQDVLWLWGHEHRLAVYDRYTEGPITAFGRCIGHGGMPVELIRPRTGSRAALRFYDRRTYTTVDGHRLGFNGFLNLQLEGKTATLDYRDVNNKSVLLEQFESQGRRLRQTVRSASKELGVCSGNVNFPSGDQDEHHFR